MNDSNKNYFKDKLQEIDYPYFSFENFDKFKTKFKTKDKTLFLFAILILEV